MSLSLSELRSMPEEKLIAQYDKKAESTDPGVNYYLAELARRDQDRQTQAMLRYTHWITVMTVIMTIATVVNLGVAFLLIFK